MTRGPSVDLAWNASGYKLFRRDRDLQFYEAGLFSNKYRGGVLAYVKDDLHPVVQDNLSVSAELLWVKVHPSSASELLIGVGYRPEAAGDKYIDTICESINKIETQDVILLGDFNFRDIDWCNEIALSGSSDKFLNCVKDSFWHQIIDKPTRDRYINDIVLVGNNSLVQDSTVGEHFG